MGVYLYPSGTETELKNAYIGEVHEFYYNFVGKTIAQVNSDLGLTLPSSYSIDGNGIKSTSRNPVVFSLPFTTSGVSSLELTVEGRIGTSGTQDILIMASDTNVSNGFGIYQSYSNNNKITIGGTATSYDMSVSNYDFTCNVIFDLVNGQATLKYTQGSSFTNTYTISSSQAELGKTLSKIRLAINGSDPRVKTIRFASK